MPQVTAQTAVRMDGVDFNYTVRTQVGFEFYDNAFESFGQSTYEDVALVQYGPSGAFIAGFGGTGVRWNGTYTVATSGTVTGYLELVYVGGTWIESLLIENMRCSASDFVAAFMSGSRSDDVAIIERVLSQADNFQLSPYADYARGYGGDDGLTGGDGNDTLFGDAGEDNLNGGLGRDRLDGGTGDDNLSGGIGNDTLAGGTGRDTLDGSSGSDVMTGGAGNDLYYVDSSGDRATEVGGGGLDTVYATVDYALAAYIENLQLKGTAALDANGNDGDNRISGNASANVLDGKAGDDQLIGWGGSDDLRGGTGNDTLTGGVGADKLRGGTGADVFDFDRAAELGLRERGTHDVIFDFSRSQGDRIDVSDMGSLRLVDADDASAGDAMTMWITGGGTFCYINFGLDGDAEVDAQIKVAGVGSLTTSDFMM